MRLRFTVAGAITLALTLHVASETRSQTPNIPQGLVPLSAEEEVVALMRSAPPVEETSRPAPRGADGKPDFTGFWRPVREPGKPGGNLGKDYPDFRLPLNGTGRRAQIALHLPRAGHAAKPRVRKYPSGLRGVPRTGSQTSLRAP